jgi:hypothetical protein
MWCSDSLSLTGHVNHWLASSHQPRILHIFDSACNMINERGEVLSIVTQQIGDGPFNLVVDNNTIFTEHCAIENPVSILSDQLLLGDLIINTTGATLWNPLPNWDLLHATQSTIVDALINLELISSWSLMPNLSANMMLLDADQQSLLSRFSVAAAMGDISTVSDLSARLAGLGIGLTPSADDFMLGATYAAWIIHPPEIASAVASEVARAAAPRTTSLSAAWLRAAGRGEAGVLWHEFFTALLSEDQARGRASVESMLHVGETSGADALGGFLVTLHRWTGLKTARIP